MKDSKKKIFIVISILLALVVALVFLNIKEKYTYSIVVVTLLFICIIALLRLFYCSGRTEEEIYNKVLRTILNTYENILIDIDKMPEVNPINIIKVNSFEKMIDIQRERKKPVFYKLSINSCLFMIMDETEIYVYVLRMKEDSYSPLDEIIKNIEKNTEKTEKDNLLLENIEKTTVIKLDNLKEYKISPIREEDVLPIQEDQIIVKLKKDYLGKKK